MGMATAPTRVVCPLDPVYNVSTTNRTSVRAQFTEERGVRDLPRTHEGNQGVHGAVAGSKPRALTRDNGEPQFSLMRDDIAGGAPQRWIGSVPANIYDSHDIRPVIDYHDPHDIAGAQVSSLKKGIITRRSVNPLNPRYMMLDGDAKPPPVPVMPAEREHNIHPSLLRQAATSSMPNLHAPCVGSGRVTPLSCGPSQYGPAGSGRATPLSSAQNLHGPGAGSGRATPMSSHRSMGRASSVGALRHQDSYGGAAHATSAPPHYGGPRQESYGDAGYATGASAQYG